MKDYSVVCGSFGVKANAENLKNFLDDWTEQMKKNLEKLSGGFNKRLHDELESLEEQLLLVVGGKQNFHDNKK